MATNSKLARAVRLALITGMATGGMTSMSAANAQDIDARDDLEEITVTGSRIAKRDAIAESPIFTIDQDTIRGSGNVTLDHYLNTLPQLVPSISSQSNNPSSGGRAFIDLRGLGSERNLVLMDGRRAMGQINGGTTVDANTIPAALIDRVEIISGGAAATYGADAIAGVVNFIMKKDFEGVALDTQYRMTEEGDGEELTLDLTLGNNFADGMGNAVFNASYFDREAMYKDARWFSEQAVSATGIFPNGSWATGSNTPDQTAVDALFGPGACTNTGGSGGFGFNPDGSPFCTGVSGNSSFNMVNYNGPAEHVATEFAPDRFSYNFEPDNILVLPMERWSLYTHMNLELDDSFQPYVQAMYTNYNALQELAATPAAGFLVPVTNPFIPADIQTLLASRTGCAVENEVDPTVCDLQNVDAPMGLNYRFNKLGGRTGYNTHDVWQLVAGTKGDLIGTWTYDVYGTYGRSVRNEVQGGNVRVPETQELLDAADGGASICEGGLNLFGDTTISAACMDYISLQAKQLTVVEQGVIEAVANGDVFELPAGTVQAAIGASYRNLDFDFLPDSGLKPGLVAGFNEQLPVSGRLDYTDLFAEVSIPIVGNLPGIQELSTTLGYRSTDNNIFGQDDSWKVTFDWTITDSIRARGGLQHAIRSPNINELFAPQLNNFPAYTDPCNFDSPYRTGANAAQVTALCAAQASIAGDGDYSQSFGQAQAIVGGNPDLTPEQADSWTAGLVFTPESSNPFLQRMTFSVDYFSIELEEVIAAVTTNTIITRCFNAEGANPTFDNNNEWCALFDRDPLDGRVVDLLQLSQNQAIWELSGVDIAANMGMDVGPGELDFAVIASYLNSYTTQTTAVDQANEWAGTIGSVTGTATPEWRGTIQTTYTMNTMQVNLVVRYIDDMFHNQLVTNPLSTATGTDATWYTDILASWDVNDNLSLRMGINNVANQWPRLYNPPVQASTDPSMFDVLGRRYFVGLVYRL